MQFQKKYWGATSSGSSRVMWEKCLLVQICWQDGCFACEANCGVWSAYFTLDALSWRRSEEVVLGRSTNPLTCWRERLWPWKWNPLNSPNRSSRWKWQFWRNFKASWALPRPCFQVNMRKGLLCFYSICALCDQKGTGVLSIIITMKHVYMLYNFNLIRHTTKIFIHPPSFHLCWIYLAPAECRET